MPPKKFALNQTHGYIDDKPPIKSKPKPIIVPQELTEYYLLRDREIFRTCNNEQTKAEILLRYKKD